MKKILALLIAGIMVIALAACGESTAATTAAGGESVTTVPEEAVTKAGETTAGEVATEAVETGQTDETGRIYDVGEFTICVPSGWIPVSQIDITKDPDENGDYPACTDAIGLCKGGTSELDEFDNPTVYVYYWTDDTAQDNYELYHMFAEESEDIDVEINGTECLAFESKEASYINEGEYDIYNYVFYPISDTDHVQFTIPISVSGKGVNLEDEDVQAILNGFVLN